MLSFISLFGSLLLSVVLLRMDWLPTIDYAARPFLAMFIIEGCALKRTVECRLLGLLGLWKIIDPLLLLTSRASFLELSSWLMLEMICFRSIALLISKDSNSSSLLVNSFDTPSKLFFCSETKVSRLIIVFLSLSTSWSLLELDWLTITEFIFKALSSFRSWSLSFSIPLSSYWPLRSLALTSSLKFLTIYSDSDSFLDSDLLLS